ncbi:sugar ABC transporter ATP-binding protein [Dysosmobacter sp.]|uniref:sugar ABC transporter ATP-binding protein n=1 Tax=Dysosmobacter sp. TaxID=2591382 RepID=UPI002A8AEB04|nr:sugar ABC transporter ATP-binding protein [Dysosmobacter sp.]MDY3281076.1 sugar ABC transporter ATP-binding protein [Dysosmobacter sp.]
MLLQTEGVSKKFNGIYALRDVDFSLEAGEIHGLVGENGAGKSTLIKLLTGVYRLREGRVLWNGQPVSITSPADSRRLGIRVIHQDRTLIPAFNGVENCYLGLEYPTRLGRVDWAAMERRVRRTMEGMGIALDLKKTAAELSPPQRTELEIVRARMTDCRLLILDEPTASLTDQEAERLFRLVRELGRQGTAILYVTHRLDEIFRLTDRVTVLRNGWLVETLPTASVTKEELVAKMTDQTAVEPPRRRETFGPALLEVRNLATRDGRVREGNLTVRGGEILGLFGLGGSGRTELLECIFGCRRAAGGTVALDGKARPGLTPEKAIRSGMVLISEDRRGKAMIANLSVRDNILLSSIDTYARRGVLRTKAGNAAAAEQIDALRIRLASPLQRMAELSGGNQQKAVFARALMTAPRVFLCDEPTQAVDVATRGDIHRLLREKADRGAGVLYVSSDLKELLEVADTIAVMVRGRTVQCWKNENLTARQVLACCYADQEKEAQP